LISHIFTAANYEYCVSWIFHQDGTIQLEIKLTGILNTYSLNPGEQAAPWGTEVYPGVNAHNHQHLFCLRLDPNIDGPANTVFIADAVAAEAPVGSEENFYGNAFYAKKTKVETMGKSMSDYDGALSRTWEMSNTNKVRHDVTPDPSMQDTNITAAKPILPQARVLQARQPRSAPSPSQRRQSGVEACRFRQTRRARHEM
jgi:Cu2+-containing amine oxidase